MPQQKFTVQVTTLPDCDDITRFDGTPLTQIAGNFWTIFDILACISDSYLRLTTAHTQAKK
jgi:hypothetical protein